MKFITSFILCAAPTGPTWLMFPAQHSITGSTLKAKTKPIDPTSTNRPKRKAMPSFPAEITADTFSDTHSSATRPHGA